MSHNLLVEYWYYESSYRNKGVEAPINTQYDIDSLLYDYWNYQRTLHNVDNNNAIKLVA
jgi:hypothetical protein